MIDTRSVYESLEKDDDPSKAPDETAASSTQVENTAETEPKTETTTVDSPKEEVKDTTDSSPKTEPADPKNPKHEYTSQEKINFSFSKMKKKHREEVDALNKKIADYEKQIADFKAKARDTYKTEDEYLDAKLDARDAQRNIERARQESLQLAERQQSEAMRERVTKLYPTPELEKVYTEACQLGQRNGALEAMMGDEVVKKYIFESDKSPLLVEAFCRKPALLEKILDTSDNRKGFAMYDLEQRLSKMIDDAVNKARAQKAPAQQTQPAAPATPIVGKVANNGTNKSAPSDDWASDEELFKYARS